MEQSQWRQVGFLKPLETLSEKITFKANSEMAVRDFGYQEGIVDILFPFFSCANQIPECYGQRLLGVGGEQCQPVRPQDPLKVWQVPGFPHPLHGYSPAREQISATQVPLKGPKRGGPFGWG